MHQLRLSVVIPAYDEEQNVCATIEELTTVLRAEGIPYEIIVVNDCSRDATAEVVRHLQDGDNGVRLIDRSPPPGFGRAVRAGLEAVTGDAVVVYMADRSDDPCDVVAYYRKLEEGYDCVYGSRFISGSVIHGYPRLKLVVNRIVNKTIQWMFWCRFNDLSNAFKGYRTYVIHECGPYHACHFNLTIEMSLGALVRGYTIAEVPIRWHGRTWGSSKLRMYEMGRRYFSTLLKVFFDKILIADDLVADRIAQHGRDTASRQHLQSRLDQLEDRVRELEQTLEAKNVAPDAGADRESGRDMPGDSPR